MQSSSNKITLKHWVRKAFQKLMVDLHFKRLIEFGQRKNRYNPRKKSVIRNLWVRGHNKVIVASWDFKD